MRRLVLWLMACLLAWSGAWAAPGVGSACDDGPTGAMAGWRAMQATAAETLPGDLPCHDAAQPEDGEPAAMPACDGCHDDGGCDDCESCGGSCACGHGLTPTAPPSLCPQPTQGSGTQALPGRIERPRRDAVLDGLLRPPRAAAR